MRMDSYKQNGVIKSNHEEGSWKYEFDLYDIELTDNDDLTKYSPEHWGYPEYDAGYRPDESEIPF